MNNTQKKVAIGLGIVALLVWYSKKAKPAATTTEEQGGGGGGGGGAFPMITAMPTPPPPSPTTTTTPSNLSPSVKGATGAQSAGTKPIDPVIFSGGAGGIIQGGGIVVNSGYKPATPYTPTTGGSPIGAPSSTSPTSSTPMSSSMNESVKCPNNKMYSVSSAEVNSSGGATSWCNRNGHYAGSSNFVGFDGKIKRPSYKVDFF